MLFTDKDSRGFEIKYELEDTEVEKQITIHAITLLRLLLAHFWESEHKLDMDKK